MRSLVIAIVSMFLSQTAVAEETFSVDGYVVELDEVVANTDRPTFANDWWQWASSMPSRESPVSDTTGANCGVNQRQDVWYLAGGYGTSLIKRSCSVPSDRYIFFPVINMLVYPSQGSTQTCDDMKAMAAENNDRFVYIRVFLDGSQVKNAERFCVASDDCFDLSARVPATASAPSFSPSATGGYWIMLRPLPIGSHHLKFQAFYTNPDSGFGDMVQNITYDLIITKK